MSKMRAVQVSRPNGPFEIVEREIPQPGPGSLRIKVQACGVCHSDSFTKEGTFPGIQYPRIPGHEIIGLVDAVCPNTRRWTPASVSESDRMAGTVDTAMLADGATFSLARPRP